MLGYYLRLALRSMRRTPIITALMVIAIGLGIGASMTMLTVLHVMSGDPLPGRSDKLFYPHIDPLPRDYPEGADYDAAADFTWPDAMALLHAHKAVHQAAMAGGYLLLRPGRSDVAPSYVDGRYVTSEFFPMFGVPFRHGGGWSQADDDARAHVVVLHTTLAQKLFGIANPVGRSVSFGDYDFRVIGVTDWHISPKFYADRGNDVYGDADQYFIPLDTAVDLDLGVNGNFSGWGKGDGDMRHSPTTTWLQVWVELDTAAQAADYRRFLYDYSAQQHSLGRFQRGPDSAALFNLMGWLRHEHLVPDDVQLQSWLALGFLLVCMVNVVCLLLAKFLRRSNEISVRRALGARRRDIFMQFCVEAALLGFLGGALGLGLAELGLWSVRQRPDDYAHIAQMDLFALLTTFALAVAASVLAGVLPAWRACRIQPASLLKTQ